MCMKRTKANELCAEIGSEDVLCYEILPQLAPSVAFVKHLEDHSYKLQFFVLEQDILEGHVVELLSYVSRDCYFACVCQYSSFYTSLNNRRAFCRRLF